MKAIYAVTEVEQGRCSHWPTLDAEPMLVALCDLSSALG